MHGLRLLQQETAITVCGVWAWGGQVAAQDSYPVSAVSGPYTSGHRMVSPLLLVLITQCQAYAGWWYIWFRPGLFSMFLPLYTRSVASDSTLSLSWILDKRVSYSSPGAADL